MDPVKEIAELNAKRSALEQELAAPRIDKDREHDIRQQTIAVGAEITALYQVLAHGGTTGGLPMDHVAIKIVMKIGHPTRAALPCDVEGFADSGCSYPLLLSEKTWAHVVEHFADAIIPCDERVALAVGTMVMTARAVLNVRVQMSDGSWAESRMEAYKSDKDLLGLIGLGSLGLLVDTPRKCLKRAIMLAGTHYFAFSGAGQHHGNQIRRDGSPPTSPVAVSNINESLQQQQTASAASAASSAPFQQTQEQNQRPNALGIDLRLQLGAHRFLPSIAGGALCKFCGKRLHQHGATS